MSWSYLHCWCCIALCTISFFCLLCYLMKITLLCHFKPSVNNLLCCEIQPVKQFFLPLFLLLASNFFLLKCVQSSPVQSSVCASDDEYVSGWVNGLLSPLCRPFRSCRTTPSCLQPAARPPNWEHLCPRSAFSLTESIRISENARLRLSMLHTVFTVFMFMEVSMGPVQQAKSNTFHCIYH